MITILEIYLIPAIILCVLNAIYTKEPFERSVLFGLSWPATIYKDFKNRLDESKGFDKKD